MLSFYFTEDEQTAFCEWAFSCIVNATLFIFPGMSLIQFKDQKISLIHEYRMTCHAFPWDTTSLKLHVG